MTAFDKGHAEIIARMRRNAIEAGERYEFAQMVAGDAVERIMTDPASLDPALDDLALAIRLVSAPNRSEP